MMFSTKAEYGVRVMVELARRAGEDPIPLTEIAEHDGLPLAYLEHLVARLRKAGLVDSRRGSRGGYLLARSPVEITMAEVVEALEGSIAPIECISQSPDGSIVCAREADGRGAHSPAPPSCCGRGCASRSCARCRRRPSPTSSLRPPTLQGAPALSADAAPAARLDASNPNPSRLEPEQRTWPT